MEVDPPERQKSLRRGVYLVFVLSGACGLVYEVLWVRELTLVFGISTYAVATVLSAFMAGLGIGSYYFGKVALRKQNVLSLYGWLEIGIGVCGFLLPFLFKGLMSFYSLFYENLSPHPTLFVLVRFVVLGLILLIPCTLMGGTISVLSKFFGRTHDTLSRDIGLLYALNTLGAVVGCLSAGFLLIPQLGLSRTTYLVVALNLCIGFLAFGLGKLSRKQAGTLSSEEAWDDAKTLPSHFSKILLFVFALSGFCSLGYQVLWTRTLVFYLHNSTYAFTTMLATFLLGISMGSLLLNRWIDRTRRPSLILILAQVLIGVTTVVSLLIYPFLPIILKLYLRYFEMDSWAKALMLQLYQSLIILLPVTFLMGLTFPVVTKLYVKSLSTVSRSVGNLYSVNTFGCIFGSLLAGFLFLPVLGILNAFYVFIVINLCLALLVLMFSPELMKRTKWIGVLVIVAVGVGARYALPSDLFYRAFKQGHHILYYKDGVSDTVMVKSPPKDDQLRVLCFADGRGTAGTNTNNMNRFCGHLSLLLHDKPRQCLCICFGVGNTLSAIALHPDVEQVDCVELSPNVIEAAPYFYTNDQVLQNPKVKIHVKDGRNYLLGRNKRYEIIQLEPPEIHTECVVNLYTKEFYELSRMRLTDDGIICQWFNVAMMPMEEQKMLVNTFLEVFPHATAWWQLRNLNYLLLLGTKHPLRIDYGALKERFRNAVVLEDLKTKVGVNSPLDLLKNFKLTTEGIRRFAGDAEIITDDRTYVDFSSPKSIDANFGLSNAFSGFKIPRLKPAGLEATLNYYADKYLEMVEASESVFPLLMGFDSEEEAKGVEKELEASLRAWQADQRVRIEAIRKRKKVWVNM